MKVRFSPRKLFSYLVVLGALGAIGFGVYSMGEINVEENKRVVLETTKGNIVIELDSEKAPATTANFLTYVREGHYDGTVFHRVIDGFMIQGGGFTEDGKKKGTHEPIALESNNGLRNVKGSVAMARTMVEDSATSQFFINVANNDFLNYAEGNPGYAVFGKVVEGMEVVDQIKKVRTATKHGMSDWPEENVVIMRAYVS